jgi:arylsulfatase A-like enzyme
MSEKNQAPAETSAPRPRRGRLHRLGRLLLRLLAGLVALGLVLLIVFAAWLNLAPDRGPDVLLITIDTQRVDRLGCYGSERGLTPNLDRLASRGVLFEEVVVSIPRTTQNLSTLLTGLEPSRHGVRELVDSLPDEITTLAERLSGEGYRTAAFVGGGPLGREQNLYQGFDHTEVHAYDDQKRALPLMGSAASWILRNARGPWFTWIHLYDPHLLYAPPWPFWERGDPEQPAVARLYGELEQGRRSFGDLHFLDRLSEEQRRYLEELYDGEVRYTDFSIGLLLRLVRLVESLDAGRETLVVLSADHGESLGEHGYWYNHGIYLYDEDLLVPLLVSLPGELPEGRRIPSQVRTADIYPTVLEILGHGDERDIDGQSLLSLVRGEESGDRPAFTESDSNRFPQDPRTIPDGGLAGRWRSLRSGRYKLIRIPEAGGGERFELYDLESDPGETRPLPDVDGSLSGFLRARLAAWEDGMEAGATEEGGELSEAEREKLRALGYVD